MRPRSSSIALVFLLPAIPLLFLNAAQCAWTDDGAVGGVATVASLRSSQLPWVREEVAGADVDLSTPAVRRAIPSLTGEKPNSQSPMLPEADTEPPMLAHPIHRRILPSSSDEAG